MKIREKYVISRDMDWFGSSDELEKIAKQWDISLEDAEKLTQLADIIMEANANISVLPIKAKFLGAVEETEKEIAEYTAKREQAEKDIFQLLGREGNISSYEFSLLYYEELEKMRGQNIVFDKFLDFLNGIKEYGIFSTFAEYDGELLEIKNAFISEEITIELIKEFDNKTNFFNKKLSQ